MSEKIVQLNEEVIKGQIKELVRGSVEETLNELLEAEAEKLTHAARYERNEIRQGYRSGHYDRNLTTTSGNVTLHVPRLKGVSFEEGMKGDKASWVNFFQWLRSRGLDGVKLIVGDKCLGMLEAVGEVFPEAKYQHCTVHFTAMCFLCFPVPRQNWWLRCSRRSMPRRAKKHPVRKLRTWWLNLREMKRKEAAKKVEG